MAKAERASRKEAPPNVEAQENTKNEDKESSVQESAETRNVGEKKELKGPGGNMDAVYAGSYEVTDKKTVEVFNLNPSKGMDGTHMFVWKSSKEMKVLDEVAPKVDRQSASFDAVVDSAVKAAGLKGEEAAAAKERLNAQKSEIIADAMGAENPEEAMTSAMQESAASTEAYAGPDLETASAGVREARMALEAAKNDAEYEAATTALYAAEKVQLEARKALQPEASEEKVAEMAAEVMGAVTPAEDPLYGDGLEAVKGRLAELEAEMKSADTEKNEVAWMAARDEYDRHMVVMPAVETAERIAEAEAEVAELMAVANADLKATTKSARSSVRSKRTRLRKMGEGFKSLIKSIEDGMRSLDKAPTKGAEAEYAKLDAERQEKRARLEELQSEIAELSATNEELKAAKVEWAADPNEMIDEAQSALYHKLEDMFKSNPDAVEKYVEAAIKSDKTPESTRIILQAFNNDVINVEELPDSAITEVRSLEATPPVVPGSALDRQYQNMMANEGTVKIKSRETTEYKQSLALAAEQGVEGLRAQLELVENPETRQAMEQALVDIEGGVIKLEQAKTEESTMETFFEGGDGEPMTAEEMNEYPDLIRSGALAEGGDMAGWQNSFNELSMAMDELGLDMAQEGLPASFDEIKNMKDDRKGVKGFFSKLFKRPSPRAKAFDALAKAHYTYIASGNTDVSAKLAAMKQRNAEHSRKMSNAGKGTMG